MRRLLLFLVCYLTPILGRSSPLPEPIAYVWAGHPVGFGLLVEQGHIYVAYYDADRRITLIGRRLAEKTWTRMKPVGIELPERGRNSRFTGWGSHNFLRVALDQGGRVHLAGNMHADPLIYFRMEKPHDVKSLIRIDRMTGEQEERCTYPVFFKGPDNTLFFRYRDGDGDNGGEIVNRYDGATGTWKRVTPNTLIGSMETHSSYALNPILDPVPPRAAADNQAPRGVPAEMLKVQGDYPGLEVQIQEVRAEGKRWLLRWETLPHNGDQPRETVPEAQPMRLYELPDDGVAAAPGGA